MVQGDLIVFAATFTSTRSINMTHENAAKIVNQLTGEAREDLFCFFISYFDLTTADELEAFAVKCGFDIARNVLLINEETSHVSY